MGSEVERAARETLEPSAVPLRVDHRLNWWQQREAGFAHEHFRVDAENARQLRLLVLSVGVPVLITFFTLIQIGPFSPQTLLYGYIGTGGAIALIIVFATAAKRSQVKSWVQAARCAVLDYHVEAPHEPLRVRSVVQEVKIRARRREGEAWGAVQKLMEEDEELRVLAASTPAEKALLLPSRVPSVRAVVAAAREVLAPLKYLELKEVATRAGLRLDSSLRVTLFDALVAVGIVSGGSFMFYYASNDLLTRVTPVETPEAALVVRFASFVLFGGALLTFASAIIPYSIGTKEPKGAELYTYSAARSLPGVFGQAIQRELIFARWSNLGRWSAVCIAGVLMMLYSEHSPTAYLSFAALVWSIGSILVGLGRERAGLYRVLQVLLEKSRARESPGIALKEVHHQLRILLPLNENSARWIIRQAISEYEDKLDLRITLLRATRG